MLITQSTETGTGLSIQSNNPSVTIVEGVTYSYTGGSLAIEVIGQNNTAPRFNLAGTLFASAGYGISLSGSGGVCMIAASGSVFVDQTAIFLSGAVSNAGTVVGAIGIQSGQSIRVYNSGTITGSSASIAGNYSDDTITNDGTLNGIIYLYDGKDLVTNSASGIIAGDINFSTGADTLVNDGAITGKVTFAGSGSTKPLTGSTASVTNGGSITGDLILTNGADTLRNTGTIAGNVTTGYGSDTLVNGGTIQGAVTIVSRAGEFVTLTNDGTISGNIFADAGRETVVNTGRITGILSTGSGSDSIVNSGEIAGNVFTTGGNADKATVLNTGRITGGISTGSGADSIDTHLGSVGGALAGGRGNDTYVIAGTEQISEIGAANGGIDIVLSYGDYRLGIGLENLSLFGEARLGIGNAQDNYLTANGIGSTLLGGAGNDFLFGGDGDDMLRGGVGNDTIYEGEGQNQIAGGAGDDKVYVSGGLNLIFGESGADTIVLSSGDNTVNGGNGNDTFVSGDGADSLIGDAGFDTASYANSTSGVAVSLSQGTASGGYAEGDALSGVEYLVGSAFADQLTGNELANRLDGAGGIDTLTGGDGDDTLTGGAGADVLIGGIGFDVADYSTATSAVVLNGATISGDIVGDSFSSIEGFTLSRFDDTFVAVYDLSLTIVGGAGNDTIIAKGAADRIDGDTGNDTLTGGGGADVFQFNRFFGANFQLFGWGTDTITDFQDGVDKIDFTRAIGIDAFDDLTVTGTRGGTLVSFGSDSIFLSGFASTNLSAADFVFAG